MWCRCGECRCGGSVVSVGVVEVWCRCGECRCRECRCSGRNSI